MRPRKVSAEPICQLTSTVCATLGKAVHSAFGLKKECIVEELTDLIKAEVASYQIDSIAETYNIRSSEERQVSSRDQPSYWRHAYSVAAGIEIESREDNEFRRIDEYWLEISK